MMKEYLFKSSKFLGLFAIVFVIFSCTQKPENTFAHTNSLIDETSPYLLQHAHNPVDWQPWGEKGLAQAKKENKLLLISIGYSSCHWCHVMEEETFGKEEVGDYMNANYISIKVDREERPDVDQVYMTALQLMQGSGGWPLNIIALPNGKPIYGGTYHTKEQWLDVLKRMQELYVKDPEKATAYADRLAKGIQETNLIEKPIEEKVATRKDLDQSIDRWKTVWDTTYGGDLGDQKFMIPTSLDFLIDYGLLAHDRETLDHVRLTLDKMALGGLYDHLEGGFFRYSTDALWQVPHYEKMLYDNAQAVSLYCKAYRVFKDPYYKQVALGTLDFLENQMRSNADGYYAAIDADTKGEEGAYYVWTKAELERIINNDFWAFEKYYNLDGAPKGKDGTLHIYRTVTDSAFAKANRLSLDYIEDAVRKWNTALVKARHDRKFPRIDDKILTSWNALLITAFVDSYISFGKEKYREKAIDLFKALQQKAYKNGNLVHSHKGDQAMEQGFLDDYAFMAQAALKLYGITLEENYLAYAKKLDEQALKQFKQQNEPVLAYSSSKELIVRPTVTNDGVLPSANAVIASTLFLLGHMTEGTTFLDRSTVMQQAMVVTTLNYPESYTRWNGLLLNTIYPFYEVAVVGTQASGTIEQLNKNYIPNALLVGTKTPSNAPLFEGRFMDGKTLIYVCEDKTCQRPVKTAGEAFELLKRLE